MNEDTKSSKLRYFLTLQLGIFLLSLGVSLFKTPNHFATGGVSGISILLARAFPVVSQAVYMAAINVILLIVGVLVLGQECGLKTIFCSLMFSLETWLLEILIPLSAPLTDQPFLELTYAILLTGIGSALIFTCDASSGGTDIVALILRRHTHLNVGRALLLTDFLIAASNFFVSGITPGLYSLLGLFAKAFLVDSVIESLYLCKAFTIITTQPKPIADYIMCQLHRGVTGYEAIGEYTGDTKAVLMTVCRRADAGRLKKRIREIDANAFVIVTNSSEILGRGFRGV